MDYMNMLIWMITDPGDPTGIKKPAEAGFFIIQPRT